MTAWTSPWVDTAVLVMACAPRAATLASPPCIYTLHLEPHPLPLRKFTQQLCKLHLGASTHMLARHHNTSSYFLGELEACGDIGRAVSDIPGPRPVQSVAPWANLCFRAIPNLEGRAPWALGPSRCLPHVSPRLVCR